MNIESFLWDALSDEETGWSMGSFGAIAEFHHVSGESATPRPAPLACVTERGGIRIDRLSRVRPVAYQMLSPRPHRWSHGVSLCLPNREAAMRSRGVLTEIGADADALRPEDREAVLFDLGLGQHQVDFCIRTTNPALLQVLRAAEGRPLMEQGNPAMSAILKAHPHRVTLTRIGRVEVFQPIGGPDTGGLSPEGPHTHVLPKLLRTGRTHSANVPVPDGWVPCAMVHPANPVTDRMARDRAFDRVAFDRFQELLSAWGMPDYLAAKQAVWNAVAKGDTPEARNEPGSRIGRTGLRNAIRQWHRLHPEDTRLDAWRAMFDRGNSGDIEERQDIGH
ncbi:hypothetical protein [Pseudoruegeria sp. HB172150]|uniref:DUF6925 family protein n=1 Tax=Pseudoruegeria sp. HB172150 TaxID=2721164 RepID=UPI0015569030|nr:hypothetical protein [Pseudoruegeria sp. HB172150]